MSTEKYLRGWRSGGRNILLMDKNSVSGVRGRGEERERLKYSQFLFAPKKKQKQQDKLWPFRLVPGIQDLHPQNP